MALFALLIFMFALLVTYSGWEQAYKEMLTGAKVLPVVGWMSATLSVWIVGVLVISALT